MCFLKNYDNDHLICVLSPSPKLSNCKQKAFSKEQSLVKNKMESG